MRVESSQEFKAFNNRTNLTIVELPDGLIINIFMFQEMCFGLKIYMAFKQYITCIIIFFIYGIYQKLNYF